MPNANISEVIRLLRAMDREQTSTDEGGGNEIAWYYYRDEIERALGLEPNALSTYDEFGEVV